jgi:protein-tyrosine phosphatase
LPETGKVFIIAPGTNEYHYKLAFRYTDYRGENGMNLIDIHTHILPGLDDGARDLKQSLAMAEAAVRDGITMLVATPHVIRGAYNNRKDEILEHVQNLNQCLKCAGVKLPILPGAEYYLEPDLPELLAAGQLLTLNDTGRYLLVELPAAVIPENTGNVLRARCCRGLPLSSPTRREIRCW